MKATYSCYYYPKQDEKTIDNRYYFNNVDMDRLRAGAL